MAMLCELMDKVDLLRVGHANRVKAVVLLLSISPLVAVAQNSRRAILRRPNSIIAADTAGVMRAVLDTFTFNDFINANVVVLSDSLDGACEPSGPCQYPGWLRLSDDKRVPVSLRNAFAEASRSHRTYESALTYRIPVQVLSAEKRKTILEKGAPLQAEWLARPFTADTGRFWYGFAAEYGSPFGWLTASSITFDSTGTRALLRAHHRCGTTCGATEILFLKEGDAGWSIAARYLETLFGRTSMTPMRYRGPPIPPPYKAPVIPLRPCGRSALPRVCVRIAGNTPPPRILVGGVPQRADTSHVRVLQGVWLSSLNNIYSGIRGRGWSVELECPRTVNWFAGASATATVVFGPKTDTTVDLSPDLSRCRKSELLRPEVWMTGHFDSGPGVRYFVACSPISDLPAPVANEKGIRPSRDTYLVSQFPPGVLASGTFPTGTANRGIISYFVNWRASVFGPGAYGDGGLAAYRIAVDSVREIREVRPDDCAAKPPASGARR